jgi:hypothetical protein
MSVFTIPVQTWSKPLAEFPATQSNLWLLSDIEIIIPCSPGTQITGSLLVPEVGVGSPFFQDPK